MQIIADWRSHFQESLLMSSINLTLNPQQRHNMIAEAAYYLAQQRNFQNGDPIQDWLCAEAFIDRKLQKPKLALRQLNASKS
jgi:hypothetical protein